MADNSADEACILVLFLPKDETTWKMYRLSLDTVRDFARRCGLPLRVITEPKYSLQCQSPDHLEIEKVCIADVLEEYKRVLLLDLDLLVTSRAPNLLLTYPKSIFYARTESNYPWNQLALKKAAEEVGVEIPKDENGVPVFFNTGVMIHGQSSRHLYRELFERYRTGERNRLEEQALTNALIHHLQIPWETIDPVYNWSCYLDSEMFTSRLAADIIHYAGKGHEFEVGGKCSREKQIAADYKLLNQRK